MSLQEAEALESEGEYHISQRDIVLGLEKLIEAFHKAAGLQSPETPAQKRVIRERLQKRIIQLGGPRLDLP